MTDETSTSSAVPRTGPSPRPGPLPRPGRLPRPGPSPRPGPAPSAGLTPPTARLQRWEIVAVFAVSLGASGLYALFSFIGSVTPKQVLSKQTATLNGSLAPGRPLLDLSMPLLNITLALAPVLPGFYLAARPREPPPPLAPSAPPPAPPSP